MPRQAGSCFSCQTLNSMTNCPHCLQSGITLPAKRRSSREYPATCSVCGRLSHVLASTHSGIAVATLFILGGSFVLAMAAGYWVAGFLGLPVALGYRAWAWKGAELLPISSQSASSSRRGNWVVNVLALFGIFWS